MRKLLESSIQICKVREKTIVSKVRGQKIIIDEN